MSLLKMSAVALAFWTMGTPLPTFTLASTTPVAPVVKQPTGGGTIVMDDIILNATGDDSQGPMDDEKPAGGGTIVMDDIILTVTGDAPQDPIDEVRVLSGGTTAFEGNGCGSHQCSYNLASLSSGTYTAIAYTQGGSTFSATIVR
mgnify:CR=1 FL=1